MSNKLKDLYDKVFEKIKPEIRHLGRGVLYKSIQIILLEDELDTEQIQTSVICKRLDIKPSAYRDEDINLAYNLRDIFSYTISETDIERGAVKFFKTAKDSLLNDKSEDKKMEELKWIIIVACTVVGAYVCIKYLQGQDSVPKKEKVNRKPEPPRPPIPAVLCLIVPSNIVSNLSNGSSINIDGLFYLIDSASYFVCTTKNDADSKESKLTVTNESISADSNREVYIRVKIGDGRNLIDKKITYILKSNLQSNLPVGETFIVEKIACLRSLTGLESFNRV